ncbi:unnamed protein product [Sphagnum troendelagicum]|uniref:Condensin-2 complex subunit G2 n=1 Tax=Sphagnum troendelagicum TaxID=128251 RepID=A0ABP0UUS2_9BRYO
MEQKVLQELEESSEKFFARIGKLRSRAEKAALQSALTKFSNSTLARLHEAILQQTIAATNLLQESSSSHAGCDDSRPSLKECCSSHEDSTEGTDKSFSDGFMILRGCAMLLQFCLTTTQGSCNPSTLSCSSEILLPSLLRMHDSLVVLEADSKLQDSIAGLCELWWHNGLEGKQSLISQSLPFLLNKSLDLGRKADVKRVYGLREALTLFDFQDESIEDLKRLLIKAVITPSYLRVTEGCRFIAFLFSLSEQLVKELIVIVKSQIPFSRRSILEAYGEILYKAWKTATEGCLHEIEHSGIQSLIECALYAALKELSAAVRIVLDGFVSKRTEKGVEAMLFRLHEPLLFRALQVANSNVRRNALLLLVDVFPLQDPDACKEEKEAMLEKQFNLFEKLLLDVSPEVRSVAVEGVCRILRLFWEIVPSSAAVKYLSKLVEDMAWDLSSPTVRLAVLQGLVYLLENPLSHAVLRPLLPKLARLLKDADLRVRVAAVDFLLAIKGIRALPFHKAAQLESLLVLLATDHSSVATRITRLLMPSYFPSNIRVQDACLRCLALVKRNPEAGAQFCRFALSEGASPSSLMELIGVFCNVIISSTVDGTETQEGVLGALGAVCHSMVTEEKLKSAMGEVLTGDVLIALLEWAPSADARSKIMRIASISSPKTDVSKLVKYCKQVVMERSSTPETGFQEVRAVHALVLLWGGFDDLLQALIVSLQSSTAEPSLKPLVMPSSSNTKRGKRNKHEKKGMPISSQQENLSSTVSSDQSVHDCTIFESAWQVENLLAEDKTRKAILESPSSQELFSSLRKAAKAVFENPMAGIGNPTMVHTPIAAYTKLSLYLALEQDGELSRPTEVPKSRQNCKKSSKSTSTPMMEELMEWTMHMMEKFSSALENAPIASPSKRKNKSRAKTKNSVASNTRAHQQEPLAELPSNTSQSMMYNALRTFKIITSVIKLMADAVALGLIKTPLLQKRLASFAADSTSWSLVNASSFLDDKSSEKEMESCIQATATHAAKLTYLFAKSGVMGMGSVIAHSLLNALSALKSNIQKTSSCNPGSIPAAIICRPLIQQWLPDLLIAVASEVDTKESKLTLQAFQPWISQLASEAYQSLDASSDQNTNSISENSLEDDLILGDSRTIASEEAKLGCSDAHFFTTIVGLLHRGDVRVLKGFVQLFIEFVRAALDNHEYRNVAGALDLVCSKLLLCRLPLGRRPSVSFGITMVEDLEAIIDGISLALQSALDKELCQKLESTKQLVSMILVENSL